MRGRALDILAILKRDYKHPVAGFEEENPPRTPLCSNPHMHLFEAMLAWRCRIRMVRGRLWLTRSPIWR